MMLTFKINSPSRAHEEKEGYTQWEGSPRSCSSHPGLWGHNTHWKFLFSR